MKNKNVNVNNKFDRDVGKLSISQVQMLDKTPNIIKNIIKPTENVNPAIIASIILNID